MTQTSNSLEWLVNVPPGKKFTAVLVAACRGNEKLANTMNYFLYAAAYTANEQGIDKNNVEYIEIRRSLDQIIEGLNKHNKSASKKTVHDRIVDLTSLSYLQSDAYHQTYRVYFKRVEAAFFNPPEPERPKLRGRHVKKLKLQSSESNLPSSENSTSDSVDGNFNREKSKVKSTIYPDNILEDMQKMQEEMVILRQQMLDLTSQMSNLTFEKLDLTSQMSNLTFELSQERACRLALEAQIESLYSNIYSNDTDSNTSKRATANASAPTPTPTQPTLLTDVPEKKTRKPKTEKPPTPPKEVKKTGLDALSEQGRSFWDLWLQVDQNKKVPPQYKDSATNHIQALESQITTLEDLQSLTERARKELSEQLGREVWRVELGNLRRSFPNWDKDRQKAAPAQEKKPTPINPDKLVWWTKYSDHEGDARSNWFLYEKMPLSEAMKDPEYEFLSLPSGVAVDIETFYGQLERGERQLPKGIPPYAPANFVRCKAS